MPKTALLLVDFQNDYFKGGKLPLAGINSAVNQGAKLLAAFREKGLPIVHVRHENPTVEAPFFVAGSEGALHHTTVMPLDYESVVVKQNANSFRDTNLKKILDDEGVDTLIIAGAMSNMCIDAVTRAANDFGYACAVAHDACAASDLYFNNKKIPADQVHASFMSALSLGYANVASSDELLGDLNLS